MASDAPGEAIPTEAEFDLAYKLATEANCKAAIYWQNYVSTGDHQGIFEPLSKLAIELTKALDRTPHVAGWLIQCNGTKEPPLEIGGREFSTAHHAALECVCRVVDGVISETRPNPHRKFDRRCFIGWDWEKLEKRITREYLRAIEALPKGEQQPKVTWQELKPRIESRVRGGRYPGRNALAREFDCHGSVIDNVLKNSAIVRQAKHEFDESKKAIPKRRQRQWTGALTDSVEALADVSEAASEDVDDRFRRLIEAANPEDRAKLNGMSAAERSELVTVLENDSERASGRARVKSRKSR